MNGEVALVVEPTVSTYFGKAEEVLACSEANRPFAGKKGGITSGWLSGQGRRGCMGERSTPHLDLEPDLHPGTEPQDLEDSNLSIQIQEEGFRFIPLAIQVNPVIHSVDHEPAIRFDCQDAGDARAELIHIGVKGHTFVGYLHVQV